MAWTFEGERPIYLQLTEILQAQIAAGDYKPGERMPSVRDIAETAGINPNTVQRAMSELEQMGLIVTNRTNGRVVADNPELIGDSRNTRKDETVRNYYQKMRDLGYTVEEALQEAVKYAKGEA